MDALSLYARLRRYVDERLTSSSGGASGGGSGAFVFDCSAYSIPMDTQTGELTSGTYTITAKQRQEIVDAIGNAVPIMIADKVPNASITYPCLAATTGESVTYLMVGVFTAPKAAIIYETAIVVSAME